jgi:hypothetical protein
MKKHIYLSVILTLLNTIILSSCNYSGYKQVRNQNSARSYSLIQKYKNKSNANGSSLFGVENRKLEFEYFSDSKDSTSQLIIRVTSGYNEGEILSKIHLLSNSNELITIIPEDVLKREYVEEYNYSVSTPTTKLKTVHDPGGVDVVIQPDGTHEHVHRAASTKTVNVSESKIENQTGANSQIYNEMKFILKNKDRQAFKDMKKCKLFFQHAEIILVPNKTQLGELKNYL